MLCQKVMSPFQIPVMIFCTIRWLKNFLQSATAAISRPFKPVNDVVGSPSSSSSTGSSSVGSIPMPDRDRSNSIRLLPGLADGAGAREVCPRNCCRTSVRSSACPSIPLASPLSSLDCVGGNSYKQKSTASRSDTWVRNLHATISQAFDRVSFKPRSSDSSVEKCHLRVLFPVNVPLSKWSEY
jgi:hypothetical protein